jgi:hypothetical protein
MLGEDGIRWPRRRRNLAPNRAFPKCCLVLPAPAELFNEHPTLRGHLESIAVEYLNDSPRVAPMD